VNVVDAGAKGFVLFLEGILEFIKTGNVRALRSLLESDPVVLPVGSDDHGSLTYRFCTEALIKGESLDKDKLREIVRGFGDSMVIAGSSKTLRLHIHTDDPQKLFEELRSFGTLIFQKADDMQKQYEIAHHRKWKIALVADSSCDLPQDLIDFYQIHLVPINLFFGENHYLDKVTIHPEQFYRMLDLEEHFPRSAQPNDKAFENLYSHLASHYDSIIAVHVVGKLSGTLRSSLMAAERISRETGKKISVFDSRNVSGGLGLTVLKIARSIEEGKEHDEIAAHIPQWVDKTRLLVSVRTLKYLVRGGRVTKMKGFLANLLHMHPIISFDKEGKIYMLEKTFTMKSNMRRVIQLAKDELSRQELDEYMILHAHCETDARWMADQMVEVTGRDPLAVMDISPVIGVHAGPGSLAVAFMVK
jgi:DegV family protein with EDD domain